MRGSKIYVVVAMLLFCNLSFAQKIKVACVGNSITENYALPLKDKYPTILQRLLGTQYDVRNYGIGGRTMLRKGNYSYWNEARYKEVLEWNPDIVIIKMGTNDAKPGNWAHKEEFVTDYVDFVDSFKSLTSKPKIYLCYPLPAFPGNVLPVDDRIIADEMIPMIKQVGSRTEVSIIDLHTPFIGKSDFVYDKIHPNVKGTTTMARIIAKAICPKKSFPKPLLHSKVDVIFIGNSITEGTYLQTPPPMAAALYLDSLGYDVKYANCGMSGYTTYNFLPPGRAFLKVVSAADSIYKKGEMLVFSMKLGTNDSACKGTTGAPVSASAYKVNMQIIIDSIHARFPLAKIMIHYPIWYSENTQNGAVYLKEGLDRLKTYMPVINQLVKDNNGFVFSGDKKGFRLFRNHGLKYYKPQEGKQGIYYLHPNAYGAKILGNLWAREIDRLIIKKDRME